MYPLRIERMGRVPYGPMLTLQLQRRDDVLAQISDDTLFLLEHDRVITSGRNANHENLLYDRNALEARGVALFQTGRGGDFTYHGPGQVVGYPIVQLRDGECDIKAYVYALEEIMIRTIADFGVVAERVEGLRGIWVGHEKIGAIGVRMARWITMHGFALNVDVDLHDFDLIVPCGIHGKGVCSLSQILGCPVAMHDVENRLIYHSAHVLHRSTYEAPASVLPEKMLSDIPE